MATGRLDPDELLDINPEPCDYCTTGIRWMFCHDKVWRCQVCVGEEARRNGWDVLVSSTENSDSPVEESVPTLRTLSSEDRLPFER